MTITAYELDPNARPSQLKSIVVPAGGRKQVVFSLVDGDGTLERLDAEPTEPDVPVADYSPQPPLSSVYSKVKLRAVDALMDGQVLFELDGEINKPVAGYVSFILEQAATAYAGIYHVDVGLFAGDYLAKTWPARLVVEANAFNRCFPTTLTIAEIRLAMMDLHQGDDDQLLDELEFDDGSIANAARRVIDLWNETPPHVLRTNHRNFPYREWWLRGTLANLYDTASAYYSRNRLGYSAGGITIDDKNKAQEYKQRADQYRAEFMDWMLKTKYAYNQQVCWGTGI